MIHDVVIVGAGPAGLAAGIAAAKAGLDYIILEKGSLVNSIYHFPRNMVFFTTPELLEIGGIPFTTPYEKPTRAEALRYYRRVADTYNLQVEFGTEVTAIIGLSGRGRNGKAAFQAEARGKNGVPKTFLSRTLIIATGYYDHPNLLGIPGEYLPHVSHYYSEPHRFYRKHVVVVGGNNSAAEAALDLYRSGVKVTLLHRGAQLGDSIKYWVRPDIENRIREGSITAHFNCSLTAIEPGTVLVDCAGRREQLSADGVFLLTGYHPDVDFLRRAGICVHDESCVPQHDPATLETNVTGLYLAGAVVSGKQTNRVFIENGRFHGELAIQQIALRLAERNRNGC